MSSSPPRKKGTSYPRDARLFDGGGHEPHVPCPESMSTLRDASGNGYNSRNENEEVALCWLPERGNR